MLSRPSARLAIYLSTIAVAVAILATGCDDGASGTPAPPAIPDAGSPAGPDAAPAGVRPRGPYPVGTRTFDLRDPGRAEPNTTDPADRRAVTFRAWYPAVAGTDRPTTPYFARAQEGRLTALSLGLAAATFDDLPTHAVTDAAVAAGQARFPAVIFSPGRDTPSAFYSYLLEDLASHGYAVFAVSHPFGSGPVVFADGRVASSTPEQPQTRDAIIATWSGDQRLVLAAVRGEVEVEAGGPALQDLQARLDADRPVVFGHSLGGAAAAHSCLEDLRFRLCANLDGSVGEEVLRTPLVQPFLLMRSAGLEEPTLGPFFQSLRNIAYRVEIAGTGHNSFSDLPWLVAHLQASGIPLDCSDLLLGTISPDRAFDLIARHLVAFLDTHLRAANSPLLQPPSTVPEVTLELRAQSR